MIFIFRLTLWPNNYSLHICQSDQCVCLNGFQKQLCVCICLTAVLCFEWKYMCDCVFDWPVCCVWVETLYVCVFDWPVCCVSVETLCVYLFDGCVVFECKLCVCIWLASVLCLSGNSLCVFDWPVCCVAARRFPHPPSLPWVVCDQRTPMETDRDK